MSCSSWRVIRRPEYREDLDAIEAWIASDNPFAASAMWLHIDEPKSTNWLIPTFRVAPANA